MSCLNQVTVFHWDCGQGKPCIARTDGDIFKRNRSPQRIVAQLCFRLVQFDPGEWDFLQINEPLNSSPFPNKFIVVVTFPHWCFLYQPAMAAIIAYHWSSFSSQESAERRAVKQRCCHANFVQFLHLSEGAALMFQFIILCQSPLELISFKKWTVRYWPSLNDVCQDCPSVCCAPECPKKINPNKKKCINAALK